jgi:hypothetical protein
MEWSDIASDIGKAAPLVGTLLGGPAGGAIGSLVSSALGVPNTPSDVSQALATNPDEAVKIKQIESDNSVKLQALAVDQAKITMTSSVEAASDVNKTMQSESSSDHWPTYSWRPFIGFCVGINTVASSVIVLVVYGGVMLGSGQAASALSTLPMVLGALAAISATVLPILGIASYFRGKAQADPNIPTDNRG